MAKFDVVGRTTSRACARVLWCGEVLPTPVLVHWMRRLPARDASRTSTGRRRRRSRAATTRVPQCPATRPSRSRSARACDGEELLVLDARLGPSPPGEIGDLYIARRRPEPGLLARPGEDARRVPARPAGAGLRTASTGPATWRGSAPTACSTSSAAPTPRSRAAATGSSSARSRAALNALAGSASGGRRAWTIGGFEGTAICCAYVVSPEAPTRSPRRCAGSSRRCCRQLHAPVPVDGSRPCCRRTSTARSTGAALAEAFDARPGRGEGRGLIETPPPKVRGRMPTA